MKSKTINMFPVDTEIVTPRRFVRMYAEEKDNIDSVSIIPPKIGSKGFGKVVVKKKNPTYRREVGKFLRSSNRRTK